jgi:hypothetical protein
MSTTTITSTQLRTPASDYELQSGVSSKVPTPYRSSIQSSSKSIRSLREQTEDVTDGPGLPPPNTAVDQIILERWNNPPENIWGVAATFYAFLVFGLNDASYGALIPYLERYYNLTYTVVSLIFLSPFLGYTAAALCNNVIHMKFGQRGIAVIAPTCRVITYLILCFHPPYPVIVVFFIFAGFGNGLEDAAWCAWTGNMVNANRVQGECIFLFGSILSGCRRTPDKASTGGRPFDLPHVWSVLANKIPKVSCKHATALEPLSHLSSQPRCLPSTACLGTPGTMS